jgi:leader peptidase (prepilin peptidase)/N-methyltransferase
VEVLTATICGILGLAVGSFCNVVIWRVPRGESIVRPPSHCPQCGTRLAARDNVPVLSWVVLRGRCRSCAAPISIRYPIVELITALLWAAVGARFADQAWAIPAYVALATGLVVLSAIDLDTYLLPNRIVYPTGFAVAGLLALASAGEGDWGAYARALAGGAVYFAAFFALWFVVGGRALGYGDVRLAAVLGMALGWLGWSQLGWGMFLPFLIGAVAGMVVVAPFLLAPMVVAGVAGAVAGVEIVEGWTGSDVKDPAAARAAIGVGFGVVAGSVAYLVLGMLGRIPRGKALPFGPSMAAGCLLTVLLVG